MIEHANKNMRLVGYVVGIGESVIENLKGRDQFVSVGVGGKIILKRTLDKSYVVLAGCNCLGTE
jgi:hypothetical protein